MLLLGIFNSLFIFLHFWICSRKYTDFERCVIFSRPYVPTFKITRAFLSTLEPLLPTRQLQQLYGIPDSFLQQFRKLLVQAPVNRNTSHPQAMVSAFSSQHTRMALNCLCSGRAAGFPPHFHVFVALDNSSYFAMRPMTSDLLLLDVGDRHFTLGNNQRFKDMIAYYTILLGIDLVWSDTDVIHIKNSMELFQEKSFMEVSSDWTTEDFTPIYDYTQFNIGFMRVISCQQSVLIWNRLIRVSLLNPNKLEQTLMCDSLKPIRVQPNQSPIQFYDMKPQHGRDEIYSIRFYHPYEILNGGMFVRNREHAFQTARKKGYGKPWAVHLAYLGQDEKESAIEESNLWFWTGKKCIKNPPGAEFAAWK